MTTKESIQNVTERIKTFEDAKAAMGRPDVPDFLDAPEDMREYFKAQYKMIVIAEALNEGWKADWNDGDQCKYFPWFFMDDRLSPSRFAFGATYCRCSHAYAGDGSRLCFKTSALAAYAGEQFTEIWDDILRK